MADGEADLSRLGDADGKSSRAADARSGGRLCARSSRPSGCSSWRRISWSGSGSAAMSSCAAIRACRAARPRAISRNACFALPGPVEDFADKAKVPRGEISFDQKSAQPIKEALAKGSLSLEQIIETTGAKQNAPGARAHPVADDGGRQGWFRSVPRSSRRRCRQKLDARRASWTASTASWSSWAAVCQPPVSGGAGGRQRPRDRRARCGRAGLAGGGHSRHRSWPPRSARN